MSNPLTDFYINTRRTLAYWLAVHDCSQAWAEDEDNWDRIRDYEQDLHDKGLPTDLEAIIEDFYDKYVAWRTKTFPQFGAIHDRIEDIALALDSEDTDVWECLTLLVLAVNLAHLMGETQNVLLDYSFGAIDFALINNISQEGLEDTFGFEAMDEFIMDYDEIYTDLSSSLEEGV